MKSDIEINDLFQLADQFVNFTHSNIFLTGKAGSGKTTFLQHIKNTTTKRAVVVAPTGVAAINAGGMTIHSFFQLPLGTIIPDNAFPVHTNHFSQAINTYRSMLRNLRLNTQKRKMIRELELLIIDEVSMVRADLMDAIDIVLKSIRKNYREPFGGTQVLMIGDLHQLPPVVPEDERAILDKIFDSPYFFSSKVIKGSQPVILELDKIYRQQDEKFLDLLNKIRNNILTSNDLIELNRYHKPDFKPAGDDNYITLCTHHYKANAINRQEMDKLSGKAYSFQAGIEGTVNETAAPADINLELKKGAQIMFIKNDRGDNKRYYNGKIGKVEKIDEEEIGVSFPGEEGILYVEREEWKNIRYSYDKNTQQINEKVLGTFLQYPVRLAWAITIHKSQGLTFEKAIIDAGDSFTSGQVYVALSRLRSLDGLVLKTPIRAEKIYTDRIIRDVVQVPEKKHLEEELSAKKLDYIKSRIRKSMDWTKLISVINDFREEYKEKQVSYNEEAGLLAEKCLVKLKELEKLSTRFQKELDKLLSVGEKAYPKLSKRMNSANEYFVKHIEEDISIPLKEHFRQMEKRSRIRKYLLSLLEIKKILDIRKQDLREAGQLAEGLASGENITGLLNKTREARKKIENEQKKISKPPKPKKGDSRKASLDMFQSGKSVEEIATERMLAKTTIEGHLAYFVREGKIDVYELVPKEKYEVISAKIKNTAFDSLSELKYLLQDKYSYHEIRTVLNHLNYIHSDEKV